MCLCLFWLLRNIRCICRCVCEFSHINCIITDIRILIDNKLRLNNPGILLNNLYVYVIYHFYLHGSVGEFRLTESAYIRWIVTYLLTSTIRQLRCIADSSQNLDIASLHIIRSVKIQNSVSWINHNYLNVGVKEQKETLTVCFVVNSISSPLNGPWRL